MHSELVIHTASAISFVLHRDKSQTKTMKNDSGIYVSSLTLLSAHTGRLVTGHPGQ